jgi:hypothetical protein
MLGPLHTCSWDSLPTAMCVDFLKYGVVGNDEV